MALNSLGLGFVFTAKDLASGTIHRVGGAFGAMDRNALRSARSYQRNFAVMGAGLAIMGTGAAVLAGAFALAHGAQEFELGLARVGAITRATTDDLVLLRQAAIEAGINTQFSPDEAVAGLQVLGQQGFNAANSIRLLRPALDFAAGGGIAIDQAAASITSAVHVFGLNVDQASLAADQMLRITNATALAAGDMELAIGTVARGARLTGQSISEMLPAMGLLRNTGVDVSVAAQSVSSALTFMASRADKIKQHLGVDLVETLEDGTQRFRPFMDIAQEAGVALEERFANPAERTAMAVELFGRFGVGAVTGVFSALTTGVTDSTGHLHQGTDAIEHLRKEMTGAAGAAEEFRNQLLDTFAGQEVLLKGSLQTLAVVVGEGFTRGLRPFVEGTIDLVNRVIAIFNEIPVEVRGAMASMTIALGGLMFAFGAIIAVGAAIALIAPFIEAIAMAVGGLLVAMAPFALVAASIFGLLYAFDRLRQGSSAFGAFFTRTFNQIRLAVRGLVQLFTTGELSGEIAREFLKVENGPLLGFVTKIFAIGFRVVQFFRGIGDGFNAALTTLGPSLNAMVASFVRLGQVLGFVGDQSSEAVAGMPSKEFADKGARIGAFLAGIVEGIVNLFTTAAKFTTAALAGFRKFFGGVTPGFKNLGPSLEFVSQRFDALLQRLGFVTESKGADRMERFAYVLGSVLGGALDFTVFMLDLVLTSFGALLQIVDALLYVFGDGGVLDLGMRATGAGIVMFFGGILDGFKNLIDGMIAGLGSLVSMIPPELRPAGFENLIAAGGSAQARIAGRDVTASIRGADLSVAGTAFANGPAMATAEVDARTSSRNDAALGAVERLLQVQAKERNQQPWNVSLVVDGERIARATGAGKNRDDAAAFGLTTAED